MLNILQDIYIVLFVFITSFLWHEYMHIKSQGLFATGTIGVGKIGLWAGCSSMKNRKLFFYGAGLLSSIVLFLMVFCTSGFEQYCWYSLGILQLVYGIVEGTYETTNQKYRIILYISILLVMLVIWLV